MVKYHIGPSPLFNRIFTFFLFVLLFHRGVDSIDELMADIAEQHDVAQEISDTISRPFGAGVDYDEVRKDHNNGDN